MIAIASSANVPAAVQSPRSIAAMPRSARRTGTNGRTPAWVASSTARTNSGVRLLRLALDQVRHALGMEHRGAVRAGGAEPVPGDLGVAPHLSEPVATQEDAQVGERGPRPCCHPGASLLSTQLLPRPPSARCHRVGRPGRTSAPRARRSPGSARPGRWTRTTPSSAGRCRSVHSPRPGWPAAGRGGRLVRHPRGLGVVDGGLRHAVVLVPLGGPQVELGDHTWLSSPQLRQHQPPEQMVVPVPLAVTVEWDDEQVAALQPIEDVARACLVQRRVAQRTAHVLEDRGVRQEVTSARDRRSRNSERR